MNRIAAIVVTYNRKKKLIESLKALISQSINCDIYIIDNASVDGTYNAIKVFLKESNVFYVNTRKNIGGAGGFNLGLKKTFSKYDYYWLMDDDVIVHKNTLKNLLFSIKKLKNNFGFICSYAEFTDGKACKMNLPILDKKWYTGLAFCNGLLKVKKATFVSIIFNKKTVKKVGLPIKEFFIWADDSEYTTRITQKYHLSGYINLNSTVTHSMKTNENANWQAFLNESGARLNRYYYSFRNRFYIAKRDGIVTSFKFTLKLILFLFIALFFGGKYKIKKVKIVFKGMIDGIKFNPEIEYINEEKND